MTFTLLEMHDFPEGFLELGPRQVRRAFPEPTLLQLPGRAGAPVFLSCLLHGNETSSFLVLQRLARWMRTHTLPRPLMVFIGNVHAAEAGLRHLDHQPDFNRIWNGGDTPEHALADCVLDRVRQAQPFAAIDIHNNTGTNPHYACINRLTPPWLHLASLFGPTVVYFRNPPSVIAIALTETCPAVTIEAGKPGEPTGVEQAFNLVLDTLHMHALRSTGLERPLRVFHTVGRVELEPGTRFAFSDTSDAQIVFPPDMDHWNFTLRAAGSHWARLASPDRLPLRVLDDQGRDLTARFFRIEANQVLLNEAMTPSMISLTPEIVASDCLGYLMESIDPDEGRRPAPASLQ